MLGVAKYIEFSNPTFEGEINGLKLTSWLEYSGVDIIEDGLNEGWYPKFNTKLN